MRHVVAHSTASSGASHPMMGKMPGDTADYRAADAAARLSFCGLADKGEADDGRYGEYLHVGGFQLSTHFEPRS